MTHFVVYAATCAALVAVALHALVVRRELVRKIMALNVLGSATFLLLVVLASRSASDETGASGPDPVPHAMVLTGIVVAVSATALALALTRRIERELGLDHLPSDEPEQVE